MEVREEEPFIRLFERVAIQFSDSVAVVFNDQILTYRELNEQANRLAHALRKIPALTTKEESIVASRLGHSIEAVITMLAIMKAGMVYLPVPKDSDTSQARLQQAEEENSPAFRIDDDNIKQLLKNPHKENVDVRISPSALAYIVYSSGSTGKPKGMEVEHKGLCAPMRTHYEVLGFTPDDCIAQFSSLNFDASILEIMMGLGMGGRLCIVPHELRRDSRQLCEYYTDPKHKVTIAMFTPSMLNNLPEHNLSTLRFIVPMGEPLRQPIVDKFSRIRLVNGYGPAEVTIAAAIGEITEDDKRQQRIHAGLPIEGLTFFVLEEKKNDEPEKLCLNGEGELCIAGRGVARRYVNNPDLTEKKFVERDDPRQSGQKIRVYKTGDSVRLVQGQNLEITGRIDRQVKPYGKLIQPEAIDEIIGKHPAVGYVYTDIELNAAGDPKITAYLILKEGKTESDINFLSLYDSVKEGIERIAAPTRFVFTQRDQLPLTAQGKLDVKVLKELIENAGQTVGMIRPVVLRECDSRSDVQNKLAMLWKDVIGLPHDMKIMLQDNFFHLGGTSVLMMQLTLRICEIFEIRISEYRLEKNPTFSGMLRNIVLKKSVIAVAPPVVKLLDKFPVPSKIIEGNSPIFFVHTLLAECAEDYPKFSEYWTSLRPIYGINPLGLQDIVFADESIEEAAQHYVQALQRLQPNGPYLLAGWSLGGTIAYEMARQLHEKKQQVSVVLIDSWSPVYLQKMSEEQFIQHLRDTYVRIKVRFPSCLPFDFQELRGKTRSQQIDVMFTAILNSAKESDRNRIWTVRCFFMALLDYQPQPSSVDARLIVASDTVRKCGDGQLCWPQEIVFRDIQSIDTDHFSISTVPMHCSVLAEKVERMTQYQEAKLKLAPLAKEIAEKYSQIEDDFSEEQKQFYERLKLLNANQKRKVSVMGDSCFCGKVIDKLCFEWMYSAQPRAFDFVLVIDGKRLSSGSYNENVRFEDIVHDACFGRDSFGQQLSPAVISQCFGMLQRSSVLVLVKHFDGITSDVCRNAILDVLNRDEVSVVFTATSMCKEWEELKMERVEQENYVPKAPPVNTNAEMMSTQGIFPAPAKLGAEIKGHENTASAATAEDVMVARAENGDAKILHVNAETSMVAMATGGSAHIEGGKSKGSVYAISRDPNMDARQRAQDDEMLNGILGRITSRGKK